MNDDNKIEKITHAMMFSGVLSFFIILGAAVSWLLGYSVFVALAVVLGGVVGLLLAWFLLAAFIFKVWAAINDL